MVEAIERSRTKSYVYCRMPNHWSMVVSPESDKRCGDLDSGWIRNTLSAVKRMIRRPEIITRIRADSTHSPCRLKIIFSLSVGMWRGMLT